MKKIVALVVFCAVTLSACSAKTDTVQEVSPQAAESSSAPAASMAPQVQEKTYTLEEIAKHSTPQDCWFAVDGKVYDVTQYIADAKHPGKDAILFGCGKDASVIFHARGQKKDDHSAQAQAYLQKFVIGTLAQ